MDLDLEATYKKYEEESYADLRAIMEAQTVLSEGLFGAMLAKILEKSNICCESYRCSRVTLDP